MRYQIISNFANVFYKLANELRIRIPIPTEQECVDIASNVNSIGNLIKAQTWDNYDNNISKVSDLIKLNETENFQISLDHACEQLYVYLKGDTTSELLEILQECELLKILPESIRQDAISNWFNNTNENFIKQHFTPTDLLELTPQNIIKRHQIIPHLQILAANIANLAQEEFGIIENWEIIKQEFIKIIELYADIIEDLRLDSSKLLSLIPMITDHIDQIITMYEPSEEEEIERIKDLLDPEDQDNPEAIRDALEGRYF